MFTLGIASDGYLSKKLKTLSIVSNGYLDILSQVNIRTNSGTQIDYDNVLNISEIKKKLQLEEDDEIFNIVKMFLQCQYQ